MIRIHNKLKQLKDCQLLGLTILTAPQSRCPWLARLASSSIFVSFGIASTGLVSKQAFSVVLDGKRLGSLQTMLNAA